MKDIDPSKKSKRMIGFGLLLIAISLLLGRFTNTPDFVRGALTGIAIGIMITGFFIQYKLRST